MFVVRSLSMRMAALIAAAICCAFAASPAQAAAPDVLLTAIPQTSGFALAGNIVGARTDTPAADSWKVTVEQANGTGWTTLATVAVTHYGTRYFYAPLSIPSTSCTDLRVTVKSGTVAVKQVTTKPCTLAPTGAPFTAVAASQVHTCGLRSNGTVACWGDDDLGEVGGGGGAGRYAPYASPVPDLTDATAIAVGGTNAGGPRSCALRANKTVVCWGVDNYDGERFEGSSTPEPIETVSDAVGISVGDDSACAVRTTGRVVCWGFNAYGQLGNGTTTPVFGYAYPDGGTPVQVAGVTDAVAVTSGADHACALRATKQIVCWGRNQYGQLGNNTTTGTTGKTTPVTVQGISDATAIAAGTGHTCALRASKSVYCWGWNTRGQLGNGTTTNSKIPVKAGTLADATQIAVNDVHTCATRANKTVVCWGGNSSGEIGDGTVANKLVPTAVSGLTDATSVGTGRNHSCATRTAGGVRCWGRNTTGQLGNGQVLTETSVPLVATSVPAGAVALAGGQQSTCSIAASGAIACWGLPGYRDESTDGTPVPIPTVPTVSGPAAVAIGGSHSCAVRSSGTVACWGSNDSGELGNGTTTVNDRTVDPVTVTGLADATAVAVSYGASCALRAGGTVVCWGANDRGQLGRGSGGGSTTPVAVTGLSGVVSIASGGDTTCAVRANSTVACWGSNYHGLLGAGLASDSSATPVTVSGLTDATKISIDGIAACAVKNGGKVVCWGDSSNWGSLGNGTSGPDAQSSTPVPVSGLTDAKALSSYGGHTCALRTGGGIACWGGSGTYKVLGNGTVGDAAIPAQVVGITDATSIAVGLESACALRAGGQVLCWGRNYLGPLGFSDARPQPLATDVLAF